MAATRIVAPVRSCQRFLWQLVLLVLLLVSVTAGSPQQEYTIREQAEEMQVEMLLRMRDELLATLGMPAT